ncbi:MAG: hypothetical protein N3A53_00005 [Verrucomicrobiae bacterium]|nr:hypothetical protein [Verrucomicrobiae bacterium]
MNSVLAAAVGLLFSIMASVCFADAGGTAVARIIAIPRRDNGYGNLDATTITSQEQLGAFLTRAAKERELAWQNFEAFQQSLRQAAIDFAREALVILPHTEPSGSISVDLRLVRVEDNRLICQIDRHVPAIGTDDMAYYCFAIAVVRSRISEIEVQIPGRPSQRFVIDSATLVSGPTANSK